MGNLIEKYKGEKEFKIARTPNPVYFPNDHKFLFKALIVNESSSGGTKFSNRINNNTYNDEYRKTIGVDLDIKTYSISGKEVKVQFWDAGSDSRFQTIASSYYRGCNILFIVTKTPNTLSLDQYLNKIDDKCKIIVIKSCIDDNNSQDKPNQVVIDQIFSYIEYSSKYNYGYINSVSVNVPLNKFLPGNMKDVIKIIYSYLSYNIDEIINYVLGEYYKFYITQPIMVSKVAIC